MLSFVDAVFAPLELAGAIQPRAEPERVVHEAVRHDHAGCVDVWPLEVEKKGEEREAWDAPLDAEPEDSANRRLARRIADEIKALIDRGEAVFDKDAKAWRDRSGAKPTRCRPSKKSTVERARWPVGPKTRHHGKSHVGGT